MASALRRTVNQQETRTPALGLVYPVELWQLHAEMMSYVRKYSPTYADLFELTGNSDTAHREAIKHGKFPKIQRAIIEGYWRREHPIIVAIRPWGLSGQAPLGWYLDCADGVTYPRKNRGDWWPEIGARFMPEGDECQ